jgi:VEFS-Box of polycomb protein
MAWNCRRFCKCARDWFCRLLRGELRASDGCRNHATLTYTFVSLGIRMKALYELTDVTSKEKHFFLMWNEFMRKNPVLSEVQLSANALQFVREYSFAIVDHQLEEQLIAHITNMWYEGVVGRRVLLDCMDLFNELEVQRRTSKQPL